MANFTELQRAGKAAEFLSEKKGFLKNTRLNIKELIDRTDKLVATSSLPEEDIAYMKTFFQELLVVFNTKMATFQLPTTVDDSTD